MKIAMFFALSTVATTLIGCVGPFTDATKTSAGYDTPTDPNKIEILEMEPHDSYKEVGTMLTEGWTRNDVAKMHNALRDKAAPLGATAVVIFPQPYFIFDGFGNRFFGYNAVAIRK